MDRPNDAATDASLDPIDVSDPDAVLALFDAICDRAGEVLAANANWSQTGTRSGQYAIDVQIDAQCCHMLRRAGLSVLSEESGLTEVAERGKPQHIVIVDPLDGSTNAERGLPWCATALCLVSDGRPTVAMVTNLRTGTRYTAVLGQGATCDRQPTTVGDAPDLAAAVVAVNARPPDSFRPAQYRSMGATALDIASVATPGGFDASIDFDDDRIGVWDYLAAALIVVEAGGVVVDVEGRELVTLDHADRRRPVAAKSEALLDELLEIARGG